VVAALVPVIVSHCAKVLGQERAAGACGAYRVGACHVRRRAPRRRGQAEGLASPVRWAYRTAWARSRAPVFAKIRLMWVFTVALLTNRRRDISAFESPAANRVSPRLRAW